MIGHTGYLIFARKIITLADTPAAAGQDSGDQT
jgi:hypothetical protein